MSSEREIRFTVELWRRLNEYLARYSVNGHRLRAEHPDSVMLKGKVPDIVVVDVAGRPVLIIETKRKAEGSPGEEFLNPLSPAPIAQAVCYATLALYEYGLEKTPLFATANRDSLILFKGIDKEELVKIVNTDKCLEPKRSPEDWVKALQPGGLSVLLEKYIDAYIDNPLKDESIKKLFEHVGRWLTGCTLPPVAFYKVFVSQLRSYIEDLYVYMKDSVKTRLLNEKEYFVLLYNKARKMGYPHGLLSGGLLTLKCPPHPRERLMKKLCEYVRELLERKVSGKRLTAERAYEILSSMSRKRLSELYSELREAGRVRESLRREEEEALEKMRVEDILSFENLAKMMAYALANKILAYKILELHYGKHLPRLKAVRYGETIEINGRKFTISSPNDVLDLLNHVFAHASSKLEEVLKIRDFSPLFKTGLFDEPILEGIEAIDKVNKIIDLIDGLKLELKHLPGVIGYVYEGLLPPGERHRLGQFYTPPAIARLISRWAIRSGDDKVLDAGCGSGTFLIEAYKRLLMLKFNKNYDSGQYPSCSWQYNEHQEILNQLYGIDRNAFASLLTSIHLMLMEPRCPISKLNIETRDFFTLKRGTFGFEEVIDDFDAVVGNPPYTRWVEIPDDTKDLILEELKDELSRYNLRADTRRGREPGIYIYWIMHSTKNLLRNGGRLGMIISNMWLQTDYGVDFGKFLLDNFKIKALIDLSFRLFEALISTVIILAEREEDPKARGDNIVTLIRIPPKIGGEMLDVERTGKVLDEVLKCIENSFKADGSLDIAVLSKCKREYGIYCTQVRQRDMPRDRKWVSLFFARVEDIVRMLEEHQLIVRLSKWFEPSRGNSVWSIWALRNGRRPDLGAKDFFYFNDEKMREWGIPSRYLAPAITKAQYVKTFVFTEEDWKRLRVEGKNCYMFMCSEPVDELPGEVREYIRWGETECRTQIRGTRGGGRICSEAEACRARARHPAVFSGWYDLGGYIPAPIMAIYQARYHPQFFLCETPVITYHGIITFIPKIKIHTSFMEYDPEDYKQYLPEVNPNTVLDEAEIKALLAYLNSTFNWIWIEQNARYIAKGPLGLEVRIARIMPVLNVKKLKRGDVEELAKMFDELEARVRQLIGGKGTKLEMFKAIKPYFQAIDHKIAELLGMPIDIEWLWDAAWEMMERRVKGARGPTRPGAEITIDVGGRRRRRGRRSASSESPPAVPLDKWLGLEEQP